MRFDPYLLDRDTELEFKRFFKWTGEEVWRKKISKLEQLPRVSPSHRGYLRQRNPLVVCVERYFNLTKEGRTVWKHLDPASLKICGYIKLLNRMAQDASANFLHRLKGSIFDDDGIKGFLYELDLAIHFFNQDFNVTFIDLEGWGTYDLLVAKENFEMEIECKRKSIDAGRKIKKGDFYRLADVLFAELEGIGRGIAVSVRSEGIIGSDQALYGAIARTVKEISGSDRCSARISNVDLTIQHLPDNLHIRSKAEFDEALRPFECPFGYYAAASRPPSTTILICESAERTKINRAIYDDLKKGASQLTGTRPAILTCLIEEVEDKDWAVLRQPGYGLQAITKRLFSNPSRQHINLLVFSSDRSDPKREGNILSFTDRNLQFLNPKARFLVPNAFLGV
jgi:hypothetical protein